MAENIIMGTRPVLEAIEAGKKIDKILLKKGIESYITDMIVEKAKESSIQLQYVPIEKLNRMTRGNHQGVVAQMSMVEYAEITDVIDLIEGKDSLVVVLDSVTDVRNFGAIARSAECAGAAALIVSLKNSAPVTAEAIKSSAGALNIIPVCRVGSIRNTIKMLKINGMNVVAATEKGEKSIFESDMKGPTVVVMGSEDTGISNEVLKLCDNLYSIPMKGKIESLNVAAAASIVLFEAVRQRG